MNNSIKNKFTNHEPSGRQAEIIKKACAKIAPMWPLDRFVAVNPFLGITDLTFDQAAHQLNSLAQIQMTMPISYYLDAWMAGDISGDQLDHVLSKQTSDLNREKFLKIATILARKPENASSGLLSTITDLADQISHHNWRMFFKEYITFWGSAYFDQGQALWPSTDQSMPIYTSWREDAGIDRSPEIHGLKKFRKYVQQLPENPEDALAFCLNELMLPEDGLENYLHALLLRYNGWSSFIRHFDWENNLKGTPSNHLKSFLSILVSCEWCLLKSYPNEELEKQWVTYKHSLCHLKFAAEDNVQLNYRLIFQEAYDRTAQQHLTGLINHSTPVEDIPEDIKPKVQAIFCIDVRSEVIRRNIESIAPQIETLGFAGFFGFPIKHIPLGHSVPETHYPVLIESDKTVLQTLESAHQSEKATSTRKLMRQVSEAWKSFKLGAISCFSFVGPVGLMYAPKILTDSFGLSRPVPNPETHGLNRTQLDEKDIALQPGQTGGMATGLRLEEQIEMAYGALKGMSLTSNFARIVMLVAHGSTTVNNPHGTGLDCGACGGKSGEPNVRVGEAILNNPQVREGLREKGIDILEETIFVAAKHDTTTDKIILFNERNWPPSHHDELNELKRELELASQACRIERSSRLNLEGSDDLTKMVVQRSKDWSQVRPEWGLAGCRAFIAAPRHRTQPLNLKSESFLHSYDWTQDKDFSILELIMTAPLTVASWINLQYFGSTVDNQTLGSGNKTLHNITGGFGVLEGYAGDLRVGLPWQSIHDGRDYQHEPLRLTAIIEAPKEAINEILIKHQSVRELVDNQWIYLMRMDKYGKVSEHYCGNLQWESLNQQAPAVNLVYA